MSIKQVYSKYQIPPNLQEHMLRVAGMTKVMSDNWEGPNLDTRTVLTSALTHDLGNLLKFDLGGRADLLGDAAGEVEYWKKIKIEMSQKYGSDEHKATAAICREIKLSANALWIVENWGFGNFDKVKNSNNWEYKICLYCDHRIGPFGIVSLKERFAEQRNRYQEQEYRSKDISDHLSERSMFLADCASEVEKQIQDSVKIDLNSITDQEIELNFDNFLMLEI